MKRSSTSTSAPPTSSSEPLGEHSLLFQVVPVRLVAAMKQADWRNPALRAAHQRDGGTAGSAWGS